jgi:hypothetical protein
MWFADAARIGAMTTSGSVVRSIAAPTNYVGFITGGPDGNIWFTLRTPFNAEVCRIRLAAQFFTVTPCRVVDTRGPAGPYGGPALSANANRSFVVGGQCGIPATAQAVSFNFTITQPTADGGLRAFQGGTPAPFMSTINWRIGQTRANNAVGALGPNGDITVHVDQANGSVHFIADVNGYFQ